MDRRRIRLGSVLVIMLAFLITMFSGLAFAADGITDIDTLNQALAQAESGQVIKLDADITGNVTVPEGKKVVLDLNSKSITSESGVVITNNGDLTIRGDGSVIASDNYAVLNHGSLLTIDGGNYSKKDASKTASLVVNGWYTAEDNTSGAYSKMVINSGSFDGGSFTAVKNDSFGDMEINGGSFASTHSIAGVQEAGRNLTINGGTFDATVIVQNLASVAGESKKTAVNGGTFNKIVAMKPENSQSAVKASGVEVSIGSGAVFNSSLNITNTYSPAGTNAFSIKQFDAKNIKGTLTLGGSGADNPLPAVDLTGIEAGSITLSYNSADQKLKDAKIEKTLMCGSVELENTSVKTLSSNSKNATYKLGKDCVIEAVKVTSNAGCSIEVNGAEVGKINSAGNSKMAGYDSITVNSGNVGSIDVSKGNVVLNGGSTGTLTVKNYAVTTNPVTVTVNEGAQVEKIVNERAGNESATAETTITLPENMKLAEDGTVLTSIEGATVSGISSAYPYTGEEVKPVPSKVTVKKMIDGKSTTVPLEKDKDYSLEYSNNTEKGTATVTVKGTGSYFGTVEKSFEIKDPVYEYNGEAVATPFPTQFSKDGTYKLLQDVDLNTTRLTYSIFTKDITIDLNGHNLTVLGKPGVTSSSVLVSRKDSKLTITGEGKVIDGSGQATAVISVTATGCQVTIDKDVTLVGDIGVLLDSTAKSAVVDFRGKTDAETFGLYVNGSLTDKETAPVVNVSGTVDSDMFGIYAAGYAKWNVTGNVSGNTTGIEIRAGELKVSEPAVIKGGEGEAKVVSNGNGTTSSNCGIAIVQHTTKNELKTEITGGTITGGTALLEANPEGNDAESVSKISADITGGTFEGKNAAVTAEDIKGFISGGTFNSEVNEAYAKEGFVPVQAEDGSFTVHEGEFVARVDGKGYETLEAAMEVIEEGQTLKVESDTISEVTFENKEFDATVVNGTEKTIKVNGYEVEPGKKINTVVAALKAQIETLNEEKEELKDELALAIEERDSAKALLEQTKKELEEKTAQLDEANAKYEQAEKDLEEATKLKDEAITEKEKAEAEKLEAQAQSELDKAAKEKAEAERDQAVAARETAEAEKLAAENEAKVQKALAEKADAQVAELNNKLLIANQEKGIAEGKAKVLEEELEKTETELDSLKTEKTRLEKDIEDKNAEIAEKTAEIEALDKEVASTKTALEEANSALSEKTSQVEELTSKRDELQTALDSANETIAEKEEAIAGLNTELEEARKDLEDSNKALEEANASIETLNTKVTGLETEKAQLNEELDKTGADLEKANEELTETKASLKAANDALAEKEKAYDELKASSEATEAELESAKADLEEARNKVDELDSALKAKEKEVETLTASNEKLTEELTTANSELDKSKAALEQAKADLVTAQANKEAAEAREAAANAKLTELSHDLGVAEEKASNLQTSLNDANTKLEKAESDLKAAQDEAAEAKKALDKVTAEKTALETQLESANRELSEKNAALETANSTIAENEKTISDLNTSLEKANADVTAATKKAEDAQKAADEANEKLTAANNALNDANTALEQANKKAEDAQKAADEAQAKLDEMTSAQLIDITNYVSSIKPAKYTYNGKAKTPKATVKGLTAEDFTVTYVNNTKIGTATATITGKGKYTGTIKKTFVINPAKAVISKVKAGKKKIKVTAKIQKGSVKYQVSLRVKGKGKWKNYTLKKNVRTVTKLKSKKKYQVRVRAFKTVKGKTYYGAWSKTKVIKVK